MKAKEYLEKISFLDNKIESNKERVLSQKDKAKDKTSKLSPDKVQTSSSKEKMADAVCTYSDIESIIHSDEEERQAIIDTISLLRPNESTVLYKVYVDNKSLLLVSLEMDKSYSWVTKMHSKGKRNIQKILDSREKAGD